MTDHLPATTRIDMAAVPAKVRAEIFALEDLFTRAAEADSVLRVLSEAATNFRSGWSRQSLERKYYAWQKAGRCWTALIDRRVVKPKPIAVSGHERDDKTPMPPAFLDFYRQLCLDHQRNDSAAWSKLCHKWRSCEPIPGYGTWQQWWMSEYGGQIPDICPGYPKGWSRRNLSRFSPPPVLKVAARTGRSAARDLSPLVFTTRANLAVGQFYVFDDLWHDVKVNFLGVNTKAMRPLELACLDLFSGSKIAYGLKPSIEDLAEDKKRMLTEAEMRFLLAHILINIGYRREGCTLMVEHGTAAIADWLEKILFDCTSGAVTVQRSGIEGAAAFAGAYCGRSKGNFRLKAALESQHTISHRMLSDVPGQTGPQERFGPEELHGRQRHNDALLQVMAALPPERAALLRFPLIHFVQYEQIVSEIYDLIDCRVNHDLEGWEEAGLVVPEFRLDKGHPFAPMATLDRLPADSRAAIEALIHLPGHTRIRKMSPREVFRSRKSSLVKLPPGVAALMLPDKVVARKVEANGLFEFDDRELGTGTHRYLGVIQTPEGFRRRLRDTEQYGTLVNPFDPSTMIVLDASGAVLGTCRRWEAVDRADSHAIEQQMGKAAHELTERIAPLAKLGRQKIQKRVEDAKHNLAVVAGAPITNEEKERERQLRKYTPAPLVTEEPVPEHDEKPQEGRRSLDRFLDVT